MAALLGPLIGGGFNFVEQLIKAHKVKLVFSFVFSYLTTFSFVCGTALAAKTPVLISIGSGMVSGAVVVTYLFRRSPLTKELFVALPAEEAAKDRDKNIQTLPPGKEKRYWTDLGFLEPRTQPGYEQAQLKP